MEPELSCNEITVRAYPSLEQRLLISEKIRIYVFVYDYALSMLRDRIWDRQYVQTLSRNSDRLFEKLAAVTNTDRWDERDRACCLSALRGVLRNSFAYRRLFWKNARGLLKGITEQTRKNGIYYSIKSGYMEKKGDLLFLEDLKEPLQLRHNGPIDRIKRIKEVRITQHRDRRKKSIYNNLKDRKLVKFEMGDIYYRVRIFHSEDLSRVPCTNADDLRKEVRNAITVVYDNGVLVDNIGGLHSLAYPGRVAKMLCEEFEVVGVLNSRGKDRDWLRFKDYLEEYGSEKSQVHYIASSRELVESFTRCFGCKRPLIGLISDDRLYKCESCGHNIDFRLNVAKICLKELFKHYTLASDQTDDYEDE